eukprot:617311_1
MSTDSQILLRQSRVRNGIIPITIVNFDMVSQHVDLHDTFEVSFSVEQEPNVPDWCEPIDLDLPPHIQFKNQTIDIVGSFYIKTIQQRFAYDIRYRLQITSQRFGHPDFWALFGRIYGKILNVLLFVEYDLKLIEHCSIV